MTAVSGSFDVKVKAVVGWTTGHPTWPDGLRAWAAEDQGSNTPEAA
jgi:hypothetical protein